MLDASYASMPSLPPRRRTPTSRPAFDGACCLRPTAVGSASKASHFRGHLCVRLRYGLTACCPRFRVAFRASFNRSVSLTIVALLRGSGFYPGGSVSHWTHLPFLDTHPYVNVSAHTAPIIQPTAEAPTTSSGQTAGAHAARDRRANAWHDVDAGGAFYISAWPIGPGGGPGGETQDTRRTCRSGRNTGSSPAGQDSTCVPSRRWLCHCAGGVSSAASLGASPWLLQR